MSKQKANYEMVDLLSPFFQKRNEPNFGWVNAIPALKALPGLRAAWSMSAVSSSGLAVTVPDASNNGRALTLNGGVVFNVSTLAPYADFNGTTGYLARADEVELDILGNEGYIGIPGLSIGGWVWFDALGNQEGILTKDDNAAARSYRLIKTTGDLIRFSVSNTGAAVVSVDSAAIPSAGEWLFVCGVFTPSSLLRVYLNSDFVDNAVSVPATLFNSASPLELGRWAAGSFMNGRQSMMFLCASALPEAVVLSYYHQTRPLFGRG